MSTRRPRYTGGTGESHHLLTPSCSGTDHSLTKMIEINETTRATFDEITAHPFFSELDFEKVLYREYQGASTLPIIARELLPTHYAQSQFLLSRASCLADTQPWIRTGSQSTPSADKDLCLRTIWSMTKCELHVSRRMRTGGLCRTILSGS